MNQLPPFFQSLILSLEPLQKQANEYGSLDLSKDKLLTKISSDIGEVTDPVKELIDASNHFRNQFKEAALKAGYSESYVRGVFKTSEELYKTAGGLTGLVDEGVDAVAPTVGRDLGSFVSKLLGRGTAGDAAAAIPHPAPAPVQGMHDNLIKEPVTPSAQPPPLPNPQTGKGIDANNVYSNIPPAKARPTPQTNPAATPAPNPGMLQKTKGFLDKATGKGVGPGWWQGKKFLPSLLHGGGYGSTAGTLLGMPFGPAGMGAGATIGGALGTGAEMMGVRRAVGLGLAGGGAYEGGKALLNSGPVQNAGQGMGQAIKDNVSGANLPGTDPSSAQNDFLPGVSNGWTGTIGGGLLAAVLANRAGLTGLPGMAATLLGAYGGHQFLPQLLADAKNSTGGLGSMFNRMGGNVGAGVKGYFGPGTVAPQYQNNPVTMDALANGQKYYASQNSPGQ